MRFIGSPAIKTPAFTFRCWTLQKERGFHFDTAQMPINIMDAHFRSFARLVVPRALEEKMASWA